MDIKTAFHFTFELVKQVPEGRVTTYGALAKCIGEGCTARMVGWAMNASHAQEGIPAHRVVNREGRLTGAAHFETPNTMQERLQREGIIVKDGKIIDFKKHFWDPMELAE